ncbi:hypothetical protein AAHC03_05178 [Spirometra sp. Aus1]
MLPGSVKDKTLDENISSTFSTITFDTAMQDSYVVVGIFNMIICLLVLSIKVFQFCFFGSLVGTEPQNLRENLTRFALFRLVFLLGVINSVSWSSLLGWTLWFSCLGTLHGFTRLARVRSEQLISSAVVPKRLWLRFSTMLFCLLAGVIVVLTLGLKFCLYLSDVTPETDFWGEAFKDGTSLLSEADNSGISEYNNDQNAEFRQVLHVIVFMVSECMLAILLIMHIVSTLVVHAIDRLNVLQNRAFFDKSVWLYYINLFFDLSTLLIDLSNHLHMLVWSRIFSLTSLIVFVQIRVTYAEFAQRLRRHTVYRNLVKLVRQEFPLENYHLKSSASEARDHGSANLSQEEEDTPEFCAICWDPLYTWRKLPCNHCFHETCLTSWMEQNPSCPTCRRPLLTTHAQRRPSAQPRTITTTLRDILGLSDTDALPPTQNNEFGMPQPQTLRQQFPRTGLPTVRGMAVRLRQRGDPVTGTAIENQGPSLDLSIRLSLGANPVVTTLTNNVPRGDGASHQQQNPPQEANVSAPVIEGSAPLPETTTTAPEHPAERPQVIQSTIRRRFFYFDGSRYLSWLPTVHIELSEMFGELLSFPPTQATREEAGTATTSDPGREQSSSAPSHPSNQTVDSSWRHQTQQSVTQTNTTSSFLPRLLSFFRETPSNGSARLPSQHVGTPLRALTPELRAQGEQIAAMFPSIPLEAILLDLASNGVAEVTVENILSGRIAPMSTVLSEPETDNTMQQAQRSVDTELRHRSGAHPHMEMPASVKTQPSIRPPFAPTDSSPDSAAEPTCSSAPSCSSTPTAATILAKRRRDILADARRKFLSKSAASGSTTSR